MAAHQAKGHDTSEAKVEDVRALRSASLLSTSVLSFSLSPSLSLSFSFSLCVCMSVSVFLSLAWLPLPRSAPLLLLLLALPLAYRIICECGCSVCISVCVWAGVGANCLALLFAVISKNLSICFEWKIRWANLQQPAKKVSHTIYSVARTCLVGVMVVVVSSCRSSVASSKYWLY